MRFEMGNNDCEPAIEVVTEGDERIVRFWGFAYDEAERWFNSDAVMESLDSWQSFLPQRFEELHFYTRALRSTSNIQGQSHKHPPIRGFSKRV